MARDWGTMAELVADDICNDDRRRVVNGGIQRGREAVLNNMRAVADVGVKNIEFTVVATRGDRLALTRQLVSGNQRPEAFGLEVLTVVEVDSDDRFAFGFAFDLDDIDAAFAELDARYRAGEAAAPADTWSVVTQGYAAFNRHELPEFAPDWENIDHRRTIAFQPGDLAPIIRATFDVTPDIKIYVEAAHRLSGLGAVVTHVAYGTAHDGFDAEWQETILFTVAGDLINRIEVFDKADLDAALARFDELSRRAPRLENAASRVEAHAEACFAARDWDGMAQLQADSCSSDDRRRVVGAGVRHGPDAAIADARAMADIGTARMTSTVIATRGGHLALSLIRFVGRDERPEAFQTEVLTVIEINVDDRMAARVVFDVDDIDTAFEELDARYLAGEAAGCSHAWWVIVRNYAAFNRHEFPSAMPDWVTIDHRRGTSFEPGDLTAYIRSTRDIAPDTTTYIETVHRVSDRGAVFTQVSKGTSQHEFEVEWREICLLTVDGELISRCELFDETDFDATLARFDELNRPTPALENAATQTWARLADAFNRRDVDAFVDLTSPDGHFDDRRKLLRDSQEAPMRRRVTQALFEFPRSWSMEIEHLAIRGSRLCLSRQILRDTNDSDRPITLEVLVLTEGSDDNLARDLVLFDPDDFDGAFKELESRYLASEAAQHSRTWSVIAESFAALNRHELPAMTADCVQIDHRPLVTMEAGNMAAHIRAFLDEMPNLSICVEAVHRLTDQGAVFTHAARGTSQQGFDAEWHMVELATVEGDLINHCELFHEADLDAALATLDELTPSAPQLENIATRVLACAMDAFNRRDLDSFLALVTADGRYEDRRKGLRDAGQIKPDFARTLFFEAATSWQEEIEPVGIRGWRLVLA